MINEKLFMEFIKDEYSYSSEITHFRNLHIKDAGYTYILIVFDAYSNDRIIYKEAVMYFSMFREWVSIKRNKTIDSILYE